MYKHCVDSNKTKQCQETSDTFSFCGQWKAEKQTTFSITSAFHKTVNIFMAGTWVYATGQSHLLSRPGMYVTVATAIHYHPVCVQWGDSNALPHPENLYTSTDWSFLLLEKCEMSTVHARVFARMCFLTVTTSLAASRISQTPLSQQLFFFPKPTPHWLDTHSLCFSLAAMEFHENLHDLAVKEGLKGRKLHKAVESFTWNITILKVRFSVTSLISQGSFINGGQCHQIA